MVDARSLDSGELARFVLAQRWFGAKSSDVVHAKVLDAPLARTTAPLLAAAVVEIGFDIGTHDLYQLPLGLRPATEALPGEAIGGLDGWSAYDALADPVLAREIVHLMRNDGTVQTDDVTVEFRGAPGSGTPITAASAISSCVISSSSTSCGKTFSPPETIMSSSRPSMNSRPASSKWPTSPDDITPSITSFVCPSV
jgi:hypothetical protein